MPRCFLALNLPASAKVEFAKIQAALKTLNHHQNITWVEPDIAHINLHFLADLDQKVINNLITKITPLQGKFKPILACFKAIEAFPNLKNPHILHLTFNYSNNLKNLHQALADLITQEKITLDFRPFTPHITLGRIKQNFTQIKLPLETIIPHEFSLSDFSLIESTLNFIGPQYHAIHSFQL